MMAAETAVGCRHAISTCKLQKNPSHFLGYKLDSSLTCCVRRLVHFCFKSATENNRFCYCLACTQNRHTQRQREVSQPTRGQAATEHITGDTQQ